VANNAKFLLNLQQESQFFVVIALKAIDRRKNSAVLDLEVQGLGTETKGLETDQENRKRQSAQNASKNALYRSSQAKTSQFIVEIATARKIKL
jgi:hypothetical protein